MDEDEHNSYNKDLLINNPDSNQKQKSLNISIKNIKFFK